MTILFRSKSCGLGGDPGFDSSPSVYERETEEEEESDDEENYNDGFGFRPCNSTRTPFMNSGFKDRVEEGDNGDDGGRRCRQTGEQNNQFPILTFVLAAFRKSLVTCSVETEDISSLDISCPTDVRHISHVTFDRFNGFLGLPVELQPEVPRRVPSASISVFGVSPQSMQCSIDGRGNSVPTILLLMQKRLYTEGGLQAEGIFRINAENSQEEHVRSQLNKGIVPRRIDIHCLAGLIKAWFRELPAGVLDSLTPEQVMHCNTEDECTDLVMLLSPTEAALLDWAVNLMADVVENEHHNKMNARNIAMVFAPNMTQMADPLTALIHAVQVMNFLKTLIEKALRQRKESSAAEASLFLIPPKETPVTNAVHHSTKTPDETIDKTTQDGCSGEKIEHNNNSEIHRTATLGRHEFCSMQKHGRLQKKYGEEGMLYGSISGGNSPVRAENAVPDGGSESRLGNEEVEGILDRLGFTKGVKKLCRHPVFQLNKSVSAKKTAGGVGFVNT